MRSSTNIVKAFLTTCSPGFQPRTARSFARGGGKAHSVRRVCLPRADQPSIFWRFKIPTAMAIPADVLVERLRSRENVRSFTSSTYMCNDQFQAFLQLVLPDLEQSSPRVADPAKEEKVRQAAEKAIKEIRLYGLELRKAEAIEKTSERDIEDYSRQRDQIEDSINEVQEQIGALKEGLVVERKKRYNKEIYEEACKDINKHPPHKATKVSIENFEKELSALDERKQAVQAVQRLKQKQIALIMQSVADVQASVDEGDAEEEPTAGALELVDPEQEELVVEGGAEVEGDGDADDRDEDGNVDDDGDEEEDRRRSRRKRSPSADSDEGAIGANGALGHSGIAGARGRLEDEEMPDVA